MSHAAAEAAGAMHPLTKVAAGLAVATVVVMAVLAAMDADGPIWILQGALALATVVTAWRAGGTSPRNLIAFASLVVGSVLLITFLAFLIAEG